MPIGEEEYDGMGTRDRYTSGEALRAREALVRGPGVGVKENG